MQETGRVTVQTSGPRKTLESVAMNRARTVPRQRATGERARRSCPGVPQLVASVVAFKGLGALPLKFAWRRGWLSPGLLTTFHRDGIVGASSLPPDALECYCLVVS